MFIVTACKNIQTINVPLITVFLFTPIDAFTSSNIQLETDVKCVSYRDFLLFCLYCDVSDHFDNYRKALYITEKGAFVKE